MKIHSIHDKVETQWNNEVKAIIDTWTNYFVSLEEFKTNVIEKGLKYVAQNNAVAWIVNSKNAKGVFTQEIQNYISQEVFKKFADNGIKYFITINSEVSALTKMTVNAYSAKAGPEGVQLIELASVEDAITWLKANN